MSVPGCRDSPVPRAENRYGILPTSSCPRRPKESTALSREILAALTDEPATTEAVYDRVGYPALVRLGLVPYAAFRSALAKLSAAGHAEQDIAEDGATTWRRARPDAAGG